MYGIWAALIDFGEDYPAQQSVQAAEMSFQTACRMDRCQYRGGPAGYDR